MYGRERRGSETADSTAALRATLNRAQLDTLATLEAFQWRLAFVRRPLFQDPVPVVFDRTGKRYAVLEPDGSINEKPDFRIRD